MTKRGLFAQELLALVDKKEPLMLLLEGMNRAIEAGHNFGCVGVSGALNDFEAEVTELKEELEADVLQPKHIRNEIGDCFLGLVNICRAYDVDLEEVLHKSAERWLSRKALMEQKLVKQGYGWDNYPPEVGNKVWNEVKIELKDLEYK